MGRAGRWREGDYEMVIVCSYNKPGPPPQSATGELVQWFSCIFLKRLVTDCTLAIEPPRCRQGGPNNSSILYFYFLVAASRQLVGLRYILLFIYYVYLWDFFVQIG